MDRKIKKLLAILGVVIFSIGSLVGILFLAITTWGNLEVFGFYPSNTADGNLKHLSCPVFLTLDETGVISVQTNNNTSNAISPTITAIISRGFVSYYDEYRETIRLEPGDSYVMRWDIAAQDAVYNKFIMARVVLLNSYPLDDLQAACSVFVINTTFLNGKAILYLTLAFYALTTIGGYLLWHKFSLYGPEANKHTTRGLLLMFVIVTVGIIASLFRAWLIGGAAFLAGLILIVSSLTLIVYTSEKPLK